MQPKSIKKIELDFWDKSNDYAILAFSAYHISVTRNEGQIQKVEFFLIELKVLIACVNKQKNEIV